MTNHLDDHDVMETLAALRPDSGDLGREWHPGRRQAILRRVLDDVEPRRVNRGASRWIGAGLAVAAVTTAAFLLLPGMLGPGRPIEAAPGQNPTKPVTEPTWVRIADGPLSPRYEARGAWLDGRYLLVSGHTDPCGPVESSCTEDRELLIDGALYDPATDNWTPTAPVPLVENLSEPVVVGTSAYFLTGRHYLEAEQPSISEEFLPGTEQVLLRYDAERDTWTSHPLPRPGGGRLVATDSAVIVLSGSDQGAQIRDQVFRPDTATWTNLPDDPLGPSRLREAVWVDDRLVLSALPLEAGTDGSAEPLELAVLDSTLTTWSRLVPDEPAYGWDPLAVGERVIWKADSTRAEVVDDRRTRELLSVLNPATGEVSTLRAAFKGYDGYPAGSIAGIWVATADKVVVEGDLVNPATEEWLALPPLEASEGVVWTTWIGGENSLLLWGGDVPRSTAGYLLLLPPG
ncbi:MAG: hypothetical protein QM628_05505 [Propionicimonas sp.]